MMTGPVPSRSPSPSGFGVSRRVFLTGAAAAAILLVMPRVERPYDHARFYRDGASRFSLAWTARSGAAGFAGWSAASTVFAVRLDPYLQSPYTDVYSDAYQEVLLRDDPMLLAAQPWSVLKSESDAVLVAAVDDKLGRHGYGSASGVTLGGW